MTVAVVVAAVAFTLAAGFNDGGNLLAIAASSRRIAPARAYALIVAFACLGPLVLGTSVAKTTGAGIADFRAAGAASLLAALAGALATVGATYLARVPTSLSVALFASMIGALATGPGYSAIRWAGVERVAFAMAASVAGGILGGTLAYRVLAWLLERVPRPAAERIMSLQYVAVASLALGYGANDLEKSVGLLAAVAPSAAFTVPWWAPVIAVVGFAVGMAFGGVRVAKTVGQKLFAVRSQHALAAQTASAATVICAALLGGPLSTTDTSASALVGVGAAVNPRAVRWRSVVDIAVAWTVTAPAALFGGAIAGIALRLF